jgi:predicted PurR-regulated permease PerM
MTDSAPARATRGDLTRTVLAVLLIGILIGGSFYVLRPFLLSIIWATMIVVATWPMMLKVQARLKRRGLAVAVMSGAMLLVFVVPLFLTIQTLVENTDTITRWTKSLSEASIPLLPPDWVSRIPLVGGKIADWWTDLAAGGKGEIVSRLAPYASDAVHYLLAALGGIGLLTIQFLLTMLITVIMYTNGETAREGLLRFGRRLAGDRGEHSVTLAGQAIRAVALGVVVTALVQTILAGIGLAVAGVPFAGLLTAAILILCIAQIGPLIVLIPAVIWLFWSGQTGWGIGLAIWSGIVGMLDNILRPLLIRRGADLPLLLIFAGVIGGLLAFGIIGLFVGPVVLAVSYTALGEWMAERDR